ncbi:MAG: hypothetical protein WB507_01810 [Solirubrobacterales bacterium]
MHRVIDAMNVIGSRRDGWWCDRHGVSSGRPSLLPFVLSSRLE